jgi:L1 cell adhesion molecule like protein
VTHIESSQETSNLYDTINDDIAIEFVKQKNKSIIKNSYDDDDDINTKELSELKKQNDLINELKNTTDDNIIIGIDLGTTNSCVGIWRNKNLFIIPDEFGNKSIPSYVAYTNKSRYVGRDAKNQLDLNPKNVFYEVKRLIGLKYSDRQVEKIKKLLSYEIAKSENDNIEIVAEAQDGKRFTPEEISASILSKLKNTASNYLKKKISKAVITVPATFTDAQRQATRDSAIIAGLECVRIINEPTAAALAYGLMNVSAYKKQDGNIDPITVMVYDFGGGTLDISVLEIEDQCFSVIATAGNTHIGGADFDNRLMSYSIEVFKSKHKINKLNEISSLALQNLRLSCENAKKILSLNNKAYIVVKDFHDNKDLIIPITRNDFEKICADLLIISMKPIDDILNELSLSVDDIDDIIIVGGMSRMPAILKRIEMKFKRKPNCTINPEEAVAAGASIQAYMLSHTEDPFSNELTLFDVTPLSLGVEVVGGIMDTIIPRNTIIPYEVDRLYTTYTDYERSVLIKVFEGERKMTNDNMFVGEFELTGIPAEPRGIPEINVIFNIDRNGIVTVTAELQEDNENISDSESIEPIKNSIIVKTNNGRLSQREIERLIIEAKEQESRDELERSLKSMHYEIDDLSSNILLNLKNINFKLSDNEKEIIKIDIDKIMGWLKEKKYSQRSIDEYKEVLDRMKNRYGILIIKGKLGDETYEANIEKDAILKTSNVFDDEEDEKEAAKLFEIFEDEKLGTFGLSNPDKAELKEFRKTTFELCYSVFEVIESDILNITIEDRKELKDYIDDILLWLHTHDKISKNEYKEKIDDINDACDKLIVEYSKDNLKLFKDEKLVESVKNKKDELETLCMTMKIMIDDDKIPIKKKYLDELYKYIHDCIDYVYKLEIINEEIEKECTDKIEKINEMSRDISNKMQNINLSKESEVIRRPIILGDSDININKENESGTSILSLIQKDVERDIQNLIDNNDE